MTKTPITDAAAFLVRWNERLAAYTTSKPNYDGGEVVEAERMRSLETAAQGLRDALGVLMNWAQWQIDLPPMRAEIVRTELARFDALKEGK